MRSWWRQFADEIALLARATGRLFGPRHAEHGWLFLGLLLAGFAVAAGLVYASRTAPEIARLPAGAAAAPLFEDITRPVRELPRRFRANTHLPHRPEKRVVGPLDAGRFSAETDLIRIEDARVWWESDNDRDDVEDDHLFHPAMETPLLRLVELVSRQGGTLKVHDAYRPEGVHAKISFHKVGRAADLTCDELGLEKLAMLCWAAGFDWVYHEAPKRGGAHVHVSVKAAP